MSQVSKLSVKDWSPDNQPREKLISKGVSTLSNTELLAIILGSGNRDETVVELSQRILQSAGNNLNVLGKYTLPQLMQFKGIGEAKAVSIVAAMELGKRRKAEEVLQGEQIRCSRDVYEYFYPMLCDLYHEEFWVLFLNNAAKILGKLKISQGGISSTVMDPRIVCREALNRWATSVILCHNHPSGNPVPSKEDERVTQHLQCALKMLDIQLHDHIILCDGSFYSFADEGMI